MLFFILFGPIVWAAHFAIVYAGHAVTSDKIMTPAVRAGIPTAAMLLTVLALLSLFVAIARANRGKRAREATAEGALFQTQLMTILALISAYGVFVVGVAALLVEPSSYFADF